MANKKDVLQVIDELNNVKEHLVPLNRITDKNEDHLYLYHNKPLKDVNNQQVLNYNDISQAMFPVLDELLQYAELIPELTLKEKTFQPIKEYFIINSMIKTDLKKVSDTKITGTSISVYKQNSDVYTYIDELKFDLSNLRIENNGEEVAIEPIVYAFNIYDKSIKKFDENFVFNTNCTQDIFFVGIKLKEKINSGSMLKIYRDYRMSVFYNNLTIKHFDLKLYKNSNNDNDAYDMYFSTNDLEFNDIPFFSVIDIFGNQVELKYKEDNDYTNLQKNTTINNSNEVKRIKMLQTNNSNKMNISLIDNFTAIPGKSFFYQPETIEFYLYLSPDAQTSIYFPSLAKLTLKLQGIINEL